MTTCVSAPFPQLDLPAGCTVEVDLGDPAAIIVELNVYTFTPPAPLEAEPTPLGLPFTYVSEPA